MLYFLHREPIIQAILLLVSLCLVAGISWHVRPDYRSAGFTCPINMFCLRLTETLQQYKEKYSGTDIVLYLQPGVYFLRNNNTVFMGIRVFHLQGQEINNIPVIRCHPKPQGFTFQYITTTIIINNVKFEGCGSVIRPNLDYSRQRSAVLHFIGCYDTSLHNIIITPSDNSSGIITIDSKGSFKLTNYTVIMRHCNNELTQYAILLNFTGNNVISNVVYQLTLIHYHYKLSKTDCCNYVIGIDHMQRRSTANITIKQLNVNHVINPRVLYYYSNACSSYSNNHLIITDSVFNRNMRLQSAMFDIKFEDCRLKERCTSQQSTITFLHCEIMDNTWSTIKPLIMIASLYSSYDKSWLFISNCSFNDNENMLILKVESKNDLTVLYSNSVSITNTNITNDHITSKNKKSDLIFTKHTLLSISRLVVTNITSVQSIICLSDSIIRMSSLNILAYNSPRYLVHLNPGSYIGISEGTDYRIHNNNVGSMFFLDAHRYKKPSPCLMQFISRNGMHSLDKSLYNITIKNNTERHSMFPGRDLFNINNCKVISGTAFDQYSYIELAKTFVVENNINKRVRDICHCDRNRKLKCAHDDKLVATFPGKTVKTRFIAPNYNNTLTIELVVDESQSNCTLVDKNELYQYQPNNCSEFHYTLSSLDNSKCSLNLRETGTLDVTEIFWIELQRCPLGFSLDTKSRICQCDQVLGQYSLPVISCDINTMMISRQANSWIYGEERDSNFIYIYKASPNCPLDYCQQHSSKLLLNNSNAQCQYFRTGVVCGHCPLNLSTIFGSSKCQQCSNTYLLITIPIAIAGAVLVLLMFTLNLTIANGTITTFILYVNIVSINKTLLFPTHLSSTIPLYVMIAMANLDLGVGLCFYNGMDDYAKMWLRLAFPFYLMFIAALLIIASRYFRVVQRVTAQRGLPVLATLFLLSYTKILSTTCTVLFLYTKVVTISRNAHSILLDHTVELVWSVDANVTLFGPKHTILFIVNLLLLLILIPFNIILLFNRKLSTFETIQKFKPILDPYKAPYKDTFYYWAGYQLVIRMSYLSAASLNKNNNLTVAMLITGFAMCIHGYVRPFKHKLLNLQELMMLLNLLIVYVSTNFEQDYYQIIVRVIVGVAMLYFTAVLVWHSMIQTCSKYLLKYLPHKITKWKDKLSSSLELDEMSAQDDNHRVIGTYEQYREPLVAVTN